MKLRTFAATAAILALAGCGSQGGSGGGTRSQIRIVGSSTVYPFTTAVAERFVQNDPSQKSPIVESTGTGAGMKLFCGGVGTSHPDIENASRRIKASELETCHKNGVKTVIEVPIGIDGLALIKAKGSADSLKLTVVDVYKALAAAPFGKPNTARTWKDVNPVLPAIPIRVYGPPPTSGSRDSFAELILEKGCDSNAGMKALKASDSDRHKDICTKVREDGAFIEAGENDNLLMQKVAANPGSIGVLGYSFLEENLNKVEAVTLGGVAPDSRTIASLEYPGARQMFIYVKGEHLKAVPGIQKFLAEYAKGWADGGYLSKRGLIPSPAATQAQAIAAIRDLKPMTADDLK